MSVRKHDIRGHVMIGYFALLIETLIEKKLKELFSEAFDEKWVKKIRRNGEEPLTMMTLFEELDSVRLIPLAIKTRDDKIIKTSFISTKIDNNVKKLLNALGVKNAMNPERLSFKRMNNKANKGQLILDLGVERIL